MFALPHYWNANAGNMGVNLLSRNISIVRYETRWNGGAARYAIDYLILGY